MNEAPPVDQGLVCRLALLHGASREAMEATIALWPLAARLRLASVGIIDTRPNPTVDFTLTDGGVEVIAECARWHEANPTGAEPVPAELLEIR